MKKYNAMRGILFEDDYLQHGELHIELIHKLKSFGKFKSREPFTESKTESVIYQASIYQEISIVRIWLVRMTNKCHNYTLQSTS